MKQNTVWKKVANLLSRNLLSTAAVFGLMWIVAFAAAPTGWYAPWETTNPDCSPTDTDCFVKITTWKFIDWTNLADAVFSWGNVGIWTDEPEWRFEVVTEGGFGWIMHKNYEWWHWFYMWSRAFWTKEVPLTLPAWYTATALIWKAYANGDFNQVWRISIITWDDFSDSNTSSSQISFQTWWWQVMKIKDNGDIWVWTNIPSSSWEQDLKLDVEWAVWWTHFCDEDGNNCSTASELAWAVWGGTVEFSATWALLELNKKSDNWIRTEWTEFYIKDSWWLVSKSTVPSNFSRSDWWTIWLRVQSEWTTGRMSFANSWMNLPDNVWIWSINEDLTFWTNSVRKMTIQQDGKVWIWTIDPERELHIIGDWVIEDENPFLTLIETDGSPDENFAIGVNNGLLRFNTESDTFAGSTKMTINQLGNVWIWTTTPTQKLEVDGWVKIADVVSCDTEAEGTIKYDGTNFMGCNGSVWLQLNN